MTNLTQAHAQWAKRPADERFWNLDEMLVATHASAEASREVERNYADCEVSATTSNRLLMDVGEDRSVEVGNYAFRQMCRTLGAPAQYLAELPAHLTAECLNRNRLDSASRGQRVLLIDGRDEAHPVLRAETSEKYVRVWNHEIVQRLKFLESEGWCVPPARPAGIEGERTKVATEDDVIDWGQESILNVNVGDEIAPAGLYASDHDMFAFLINPEIQLEDGYSPNGLRRGTIIRQSEVGDCAIWKMDFLFNTVCGNHIIWGAEEIQETRIRHIGSNVEDNWVAMIDHITHDAQRSAVEQQAQIKEAQTMILGKNRDEVIDLLFGKKWLARKKAAAAYDLAEEYESVHGNPNSLWGVVQGITRLSQETSYADQRTKLDRVAGKVLEVCLN